MVTETTDQRLRLIENDADRYRARLRAGEPEPAEGPWIGRIFTAKMIKTANDKKAMRVVLETMGGFRFKVDYWTASDWYSTRLQNLMAQDTWFWIVVTKKVSRTGREFNDYSFRSIDG